jgi:hypothetical protein
MDVISPEIPPSYPADFYRYISSICVESRERERKKEED